MSEILTREAGDDVLIQVNTRLGPLILRIRSGHLISYHDEVEIYSTSNPDEIGNDTLLGSFFLNDCRDGTEHEADSGRGWVTWFSPMRSQLGGRDPQAVSFEMHQPRDTMHGSQQSYGNMGPMRRVGDT